MCYSFHLYALIIIVYIDHENRNMKYATGLYAHTHTHTHMHTIVVLDDIIITGIRTKPFIHETSYNLLSQQTKN